MIHWSYGFIPVNEKLKVLFVVICNHSTASQFDSSGCSIENACPNRECELIQQLQCTQLSSIICMCLYKRTLISTITPIDSLCPIAKGKIAFFIWKSPFQASFPSSFRYDQLLYTTKDAEESWSLKHQTTLSATLWFFCTQDLQKFPMNGFLLWFPLVHS